MVWHQIQRGFINFFVRRYFSFLLSLKQLSNTKKICFSRGSYKKNLNRKRGYSWKGGYLKRDGGVFRGGLEPLRKLQAFFHPSRELLLYSPKSFTPIVRFSEKKKKNDSGGLWVFSFLSLYSCIIVDDLVDYSHKPRIFFHFLFSFHIFRYRFSIYYMWQVFSETIFLILCLLDWLQQ